MNRRQWSLTDATSHCLPKWYAWNMIQTDSPIWGQYLCNHIVVHNLSFTIRLPTIVNFKLHQHNQEAKTIYLLHLIYKAQMSTKWHQHFPKNWKQCSRILMILLQMAADCKTNGNLFKYCKAYVIVLFEFFGRCSGMKILEVRGGGGGLKVRGKGVDWTTFNCVKVNLMHNSSKDSH